MWIHYDSRTRKNIREYIINIYNSDEYDVDKYQLIPTEEADMDRFKDICKSILRIFFEEMVKYNKRNLTYSEYFTNWCKGLPSIIDTCYYYNRNPNEDLVTIINNNNNNNNNNTSEIMEMERGEAEDLITALIYDEINKTVFVPAFIAELKLQKS